MHVLRFLVKDDKSATLLKFDFDADASSTGTTEGPIILFRSMAGTMEPLAFERISLLKSTKICCSMILSDNAVTHNAESALQVA